LACLLAIAGALVPATPALAQVDTVAATAAAATAAPAAAAPSATAPVSAATGQVGGTVQQVTTTVQQAAKPVTDAAAPATQPAAPPPAPEAVGVVERTVRAAVEAPAKVADRPAATAPAPAADGPSAAQPVRETVGRIVERAGLDRAAIDRQVVDRVDAAGRALSGALAGPMRAIGDSLAPLVAPAAPLLGVAAPLLKVTAPLLDGLRPALDGLGPALDALRPTTPTLAAPPNGSTPASPPSPVADLLVSPAPGSPVAGVLGYQPGLGTSQAAQPIALETASTQPPAAEVGGRALSPSPRKAPAPTAGGAAAAPFGGSISSSFLALLVLAALTAPMLLRRLTGLPGLLRPTPFVCALERPG
jgi:hypothetical protein